MGASCKYHRSAAAQGRSNVRTGERLDFSESGNHRSLLCPRTGTLRTINEPFWWHLQDAHLDDHKVMNLRTWTSFLKTISIVFL